MRSELVLFLFGLAIVGCDDDPALELASQAIQTTADQCLVTVRDQKTKYEATPPCVALDTLANNYLKLTVQRSKVPSKDELRFVSAQRMAWTALAMSESCSGKPLRIW